MNNFHTKAEEQKNVFSSSIFQLFDRTISQTGYFSFRLLMNKFFLKTSTKHYGLIKLRSAFHYTFPLFQLPVPFQIIPHTRFPNRILHISNSVQYQVRVTIYTDLVSDYDYD